MERKCDSCLMPVNKCPALNPSIAKANKIDDMPLQDLCDDTFEPKENK